MTGHIKTNPKTETTLGPERSTIDPKGEPRIRRQISILDKSRKKYPDLTDDGREERRHGKWKETKANPK